MWLVNDLGSAVVAGDRTAYGNSVGVTGTYYAEADETQYNVVAKDTTASTLASELSSTYAGKSATFVPMVNLSSASSGISNNGLVRGQSGIGHALLQGVNAALFKKLGKDVAILNDSSVITDIQNEFFNQINSEMSEVQNDKAASKFFRRYLESGRLQSDAANINGVDYNLQNVNVTMIATITGTVTDSDGPAANAQVINVIFGDSSASETKVVSDGTYSIDAHITLKHDGRFNFFILNFFYFYKLYYLC